MIRKKLIDNNNLKFDEIITSNDVMFVTKIGYFMKNFDVSEDVVYCITKRYGSLTTTLKEDFFDLRLNTRISRINFLKTNLAKDEFGKIMSPFIRNKAAEFLLLGFRRFGYRKLVEIYNLYKVENIEWFRAVYLNPIKVMKFIFIEFSKYLRNRRFSQK